MWMEVMKPDQTEIEILVGIDSSTFTKYFRRGQVGHASNSGILIDHKRRFDWTSPDFWRWIRLTGCHRERVKKRGRLNRSVARASGQHSINSPICNFPFLKLRS